MRSGCPVSWARGSCLNDTDEVETAHAIERPVLPFSCFPCNSIPNFFKLRTSLNFRNLAYNTIFNVESMRSGCPVSRARGSCLNDTDEAETAHAIERPVLQLSCFPSNSIPNFFSMDGCFGYQTFPVYFLAQAWLMPQHFQFAFGRKQNNSYYWLFWSVEMIVSCLSEIIQIGIKESFIRCECLTFAKIIKLVGDNIALRSWNCCLV